MSTNYWCSSCDQLHNKHEEHIVKCQGCEGYACDFGIYDCESCHKDFCTKCAQKFLTAYETGSSDRCYCSDCANKLEVAGDIKQEGEQSD